MYKFIGLLAVIAALTTTSVNGKFGFGGCPTFTSIPYDPGMKNLGKYHLHYVDKLINNAFTLYNLILNKEYQQFNCFLLPVDITLSQNDYNTYVT